MPDGMDMAGGIRVVVRCRVGRVVRREARVRKVRVMPADMRAEGTAGYELGRRQHRP